MNLISTENAVFNVLVPSNFPLSNMEKNEPNTIENNVNIKYKVLMYFASLERNHRSHHMDMSDDLKLMFCS